MNYIELRAIQTQNHFLVGTVWPFRSAEVEMHDSGFTCTCKKRLTYPCNHIKSVQLGLLGVNQVYQK